MSADNNMERFRNTMREIATQVKKNAENINTEQVLNAIELILNKNESNNMIFVYGAGRSGFVGRCFAQRLMHLGIKSCFVSDAITHQYTNEDVLVMVIYVKSTSVCE